VCGFKAPSIPDGEEIGVDEKGRRELRFFAWEGPEATPEVDVALGVGFEDQLENHPGIDGLSVEGGCAGAQMTSETSRRELAADEQALWPLSGSGVENLQVAAESAEEKPRPERAGIRFGPSVQEALAVDKTATSANFGEVAEARQFCHDPTYGTVRHSRGSGDLAVGMTHELGSRKQGKEDLKAGRLKRATAFEGRSLSGRALAFDEDQEGRLIQERVACCIDEFNALGPQGVDERWCYMIRHEKRVTCVGS
jgi:hypothetical protein